MFSYAGKSVLSVAISFFFHFHLLQRFKIVQNTYKVFLCVLSNVITNCQNRRNNKYNFCSVFKTFCSQIGTIHHIVIRQTMHKERTDLLSLMTDPGFLKPRSYSECKVESGFLCWHLHTIPTWYLYKWKFNTIQSKSKQGKGRMK